MPEPLLSAGVLHSTWLQCNEQHKPVEICKIQDGGDSREHQRIVHRHSQLCMAKVSQAVQLTHTTGGTTAQQSFISVSRVYLEDPPG